MKNRIHIERWRERQYEKGNQGSNIAELKEKIN
jgi:hypothetical protein